MAQPRDCPQCTQRSVYSACRPVLVSLYLQGQPRKACNVLSSRLIYNQIPINTDCISNTTLYHDMKLGPFLGPDITNVRHVKQTLPPALGGFPGEAEIKYFVKATVVRPKFYQENMRQVSRLLVSPTHCANITTANGYYVPTNRTSATCKDV